MDHMGNYENQLHVANRGLCHSAEKYKTCSNGGSMKTFTLDNRVSGKKYEGGKTCGVYIIALMTGNHCDKQGETEAGAKGRGKQRVRLVRHLCFKKVKDCL